MPKTLSSAAEAAKLIRKELKAVCANKSSVKANNYSGGSSIYVTLNDESPEVRDKVEALVAKYKFGSFNSMDDGYDFADGRSTELPGAYFITVSVDFSLDNQIAAWGEIREKLGYTGWYDPNEYLSEHGIYASLAVRRHLNGVDPLTGYKYAEEDTIDA